MDGNTNYKFIITYNTIYGMYNPTEIYYRNNLKSHCFSSI